MVPIQIKKIQAINEYKKQQFFSKLIFYSLSALTCSLVFSSFWFPSMKGFLLTSLPMLASFFFSPKFLFIIGNLIVLFLVGECRVLSSKAKGANEIYSTEYISSKSGSHDNFNLHVHKDVNLGKMEEEKREKIYAAGKKIGSIGYGKGEVNREKKKHDHLDYEKDDDELNAMPEKEMSLTKRADNYIARVNKQRRLEAKLLVCGDD